MSFGAPLVLLGLLLVPVLILIERRRRRPREVLTASLLLWRDIPGSVRRPAARRRRRNLRLFLSITAIFGLSLAGADPARTAVRPADRTLYVLVDRSPSMGAGDRLERAMAIVEIAAGRFERVRVLFSPPADVRREGDGFAPPPPATAPGRFEDALHGLLALAAQDPSSRALLVSDRAPADPPPDLAVALVGEPLPNAAVTALRVDRDPGGRRTFVAWECFTDGVDAPTLVLSVDGVPVARIPGGAGRRTAVRTVPDDARLIEARVEVTEDSLAADDVARARLVAGRSEVGLVGANPPEALVAALGTVVGDGLVMGAAGRDGGVVHGDGSLTGASGRWIAIRPTAPWRGFMVTAETEPIAAKRVGIDAEELRAAFPPGLPDTLTLGPAGRVVIPDGARVLLRAPDGRPLAATDGRSTVLAFDPADPRGNFHRSGAHVVLWRGLLDVGLGPEDAFASEGVLDAGESDLRGEERPLAAGFGADLPSTEIAATASLRWIPAALAALALLVLILPRRRKARS